MDTAKYTRIDPKEIKDNTFKLLDSDWMLITAGPIDKCNTMTASWGGLGVIWGMNIAWCVIRPGRYTYQFMESNSNYTLSFFEETHRPALNLCGTNSGRNLDKIKVSGLTPTPGMLADTTVFEEARMLLECRKLYSHNIDPSNFTDPAIDDNYPLKDYHRMYVGEIMNAWVR